MSTYVAPYIDATGLHLPSYTDIVDDMVEQAKMVFGNDVYLGIDSQDYQSISVFANKMNDTMLLLQAVYNNRGPSTAMGVGLDSIVKLNGIRRNPETYSAATVTLTGTPGTLIKNGVVQDINGINWDLPQYVTISAGGTIDVVVICEQAGPVAAGPGNINTVLTTTYGWTAVNNTDAANIGSYTESNAQLRARQAVSAQMPSRTLLEGLKGAIFAVQNVTRFEVYENDTSAVDSKGLPANSITCVVEGGLDNDVAQAIYLKKGPGCKANGTTVVNITDSYGQVTPIGFYRPSYTDVDIVVNVKMLSGYTTATTAAIQSALTAYCNAIAIGDDLPISSLWGAALSAMSNLAKPVYSITSLTAAKHGQAQGVVDIVTSFNEVIRGNAAYVTINAT